MIHVHCLISVVKFNHHSVFPLDFNSAVVYHWWNSALIFRVYCRPPSQRMVESSSSFTEFQPQPLILTFLQPFLIGKAVLPLKRILSAKSPCSRHYQLEIKASTLADAVRERETNDRVVGSLEVCETNSIYKRTKHSTLWCFNFVDGIACLQISLELVQSRKREQPPSRLDGAKEVIQSLPECSDEELQPVSGSDAQEEVDSRAEQTSPIHFKEKDITTRGK